uniref:Uncharacterized protein n=1 Tax=Tetranychus urticae TaxID=32264 RepID=T1KPN8_TETUR
MGKAKKAFKDVIELRSSFLAALDPILNKVSETVKIHTIISYPSLPAVVLWFNTRASQLHQLQLFKSFLKSYHDSWDSSNASAHDRFCNS